MPFVPAQPILNDNIVDINSRLDYVNVGTNVLCSRFEFFISPNIQDKSRIELECEPVPKKITLTGTAMKTNQLMLSPDNPLRKRKLSVTSSYHIRAPSAGTAKPPIDRRSKKPCRLKRTERDHVVGIRDEQLLTKTEDGSELLVSDICSNKVDAITDSQKATGTTSRSESVDAVPGLTQKELKCIHHMLSVVYAEQLEPELDLDLVEHHFIVDQIENQICRPLNVLDGTFSDRLWKMLSLSAGWSNIQSNQVIKAYKVNTDISDVCSDTLQTIPPEDLVQSECYLINSQKPQGRIWTWWEFRKYLPPAKHIDIIQVDREVAWAPTDCTYENTEGHSGFLLEETSIHDGDRLSAEESCESIGY